MNRLGPLTLIHYKRVHYNGVLLHIAISNSKLKLQPIIGKEFLKMAFLISKISANKLKYFILISEKCIEAEKDFKNGFLATSDAIGARKF